MKTDINFKASKIAPNPSEVTYWIDLTEDHSGNVIKSYCKDKGWRPINIDVNSTQDIDISKLKKDLADEISRSTTKDTEHTDDINALNTKYDELTQKVNTKVDKVTGKQLSTNDYTDAEKQKLSKAVQSVRYNNIVVTTREAFDSLTSLDANTLYQIVEENRIVDQYVGPVA